MKKILTLTLTLALSLMLAVPIFAEGYAPYTVTVYNDEGSEMGTLTFEQAKVAEEAIFIRPGSKISASTADAPHVGMWIRVQNETGEWVTDYTLGSSGAVFIENGYSLILNDNLFAGLKDTASEDPLDPNTEIRLFILTDETGMGGGMYIILDNSAESTPAVTVEDIPASGTAKASTQTVTVDGKKVEFQMYALLDANGNGTNYIKLRDMAYVLNGTRAQFSVGYDGTISLTTGEAYESTGTEMTTPFSGDRAYTGGAQSIKINGSNVDMTAITLLDDAGGGYNYFKLRDLGKALGFNVGYSNEQGVFIESDKPYAE